MVSNCFSEAWRKSDFSYSLLCSHLVHLWNTCKTLGEVPLDEPPVGPRAGPLTGHAQQSWGLDISQYHPRVATEGPDPVPGPESSQQNSQSCFPKACFQKSNWEKSGSVLKGTQQVPQFQHVMGLSVGIRRGAYLSPTQNTRQKLPPESHLDLQQQLVDAPSGGCLY